MANHVSHASLPYPVKNARYTVLVPYLDADGDPTDPTTADTEINKDNGGWNDCAEEVTTLGTGNGCGFLTLSGAETNCSLMAVVAKVASGPKATILFDKPRVLPIVSSGTLSAGSAGGGTLGTILNYDITGCIIRTTGGTGGGGTGGANNQARVIVTYNTTTGAFTVSPDWETTPDATTTYDVLLPEGQTLGSLKALNPATAGRTLVVDGNGLADANVVKVGPTGSGTAQTAGDLAALINTVKAKTDNLPASPAAVGSAMTLTSGERDSVAAALLDLAAGIETNRTVRQGLRLMLAALAGKLSGAATTSVSIRDTNDSKNRIVATVDTDGNRTAITLDAT